MQEGPGRWIFSFADIADDRYSTLGVSAPVSHGQFRTTQPKVGRKRDSVKSGLVAIELKPSTLVRVWNGWHTHQLR